ncbi:WbuC family cupin fold metalloprotein [Proteus mirabilis]|uniref:WbuC family cupin fold metalloprotein n=1 Tax=Proteus mirabilis TaxID=584 RepID=UPI0007DBF286|nr:WbuC family cupin fold metalloprotein [Proteus mirabilis]MCU9564840.1 WbuC family cupin fold metalloprotein [Proteus mirabilis]MDM3696006.1 WbuC family cupin fold metalloprotein [Proteus mirabilis]OAS31818.1 metalloprotein [Proteus mirabilis]OAS33280.1 metalloprotein [Proteus mirabilis]
MKIYNNEYLSSLIENAKNSQIKRAHLNLHTSYDEKVQRLFIALTKGSYVSPHYHALRHQWEMFVVISGILKVLHYNSKGIVCSEILVGDNQPTKVIEFSPYDIHSVECISDTALMLEIKEGPYIEASSKVLVKIEK